MSKAGDTFRFPPDVSAALNEAAKRRRKTQSELIIEALRQYLGVQDPAAERREAERICREINEADQLDEELWPWMESMYAKDAE